jgi:hypothetical protein
MDEIKNESQGKKKNLKQYLSPLLVGLIVVIVLQGISFMRGRVSREIYGLLTLIFILAALLGFFVISKFEKRFSN